MYPTTSSFFRSLYIDHAGLRDLPFSLLLGLCICTHHNWCSCDLQYQPEFIISCLKMVQGQNTQSERPLCLQRGQTLQPGLSLRYSLCFSRTLRVAHTCSQPRGRTLGPGWLLFFSVCLAMVHQPEARPAHCSGLSSTSVKCQSKSICKGNRPSLESGGWEKPPLGFTRWSLGHLWES